MRPPRPPRLPFLVPLCQRSPRPASPTCSFPISATPPRPRTCCRSSRCTWTCCCAGTPAPTSPRSASPRRSSAATSARVSSPAAISHHYFPPRPRCWTSAPAPAFPACPSSSCCPQLRVTLAESQGKKASFLREAVRTLGLATEVWADRVESLPPSRLFAAVTLRAVDRMEQAVAAARQRIAAGGWLLTLSAEPAPKGALSFPRPRHRIQPPHSAAAIMFHVEHSPIPSRIFHVPAQHLHSLSTGICLPNVPRGTLAGSFLLA